MVALKNEQTYNQKSTREKESKKKMKKCTKFERLNSERIEGKYATYNMWIVWYTKEKKPKSVAAEKYSRAYRIFQLNYAWCVHSFVVIFNTITFQCLRLFVDWLLLCLTLSHRGLSIELKWQRHFSKHNTHLFNGIRVLSEFIIISVWILQYFYLALALSANKNNEKEEEEAVAVAKISNANRLSHK